MISTRQAYGEALAYFGTDNKNIVVVSLNDPNDFKDHLSLYNKYFNLYHSVLVLDKNNLKIENDFYDKNIKFKINNSYYALVNDKEEKNLKIEYNLLKIKDIKNNEWIGTAKVYLKDELLHEEDIFSVVQKPKENKNCWEKFLGWFQ